MCVPFILIPLLLRNAPILYCFYKPTASLFCFGRGKTEGGINPARRTLVLIFLRMHRELFCVQILKTGRLVLL